MSSKAMKSLSNAWGLILFCALLSSCAKERDPVDRVQPYAIDKEFFIGESFTDTRDDPEFWGRNSIVDVGYGAAQGSLFTATWGEMVARVKWQITEDYLIARASYERIEGADGKGAGKVDMFGTATGSETHDGVIVAMFGIEKHFDISKAYNPTTGEKINVVEENASDRPWYERQYMRVDWSKNLNTDSYDFDTLSFIGVYDGTVYEPLSYFVEDPNDKDAPYFDFDGDYFDVTTKAFARPQTINLSHLGWGVDSLPACFLDNDFMHGSAPVGNCNPVELTLRHSFRRVVDSDFEPKEWSGEKFTTYGGFYTERRGYTRNYRMTDDQWHRLLNYYQIWERSHYYTDPENMDGWIPCYTDKTTPFGYDANRDENNNGTADECEVVSERTGFGGSKCDTFKQRCTLPYQARDAKPMAWYYTDGANMDFYEPTDLATHQWDISLRSAVQSAKYAECRRLGGTKDSCNGQYPVWFGQMVDAQDAIDLALEVDDCRNGRAYESLDGRNDPAPCLALADSIGAKRSYSPGVIATAKMDEMIVLCHSPVRHDDPHLCGEQRLPRGMDEELCLVARNILDANEIESDSDFGKIYEQVRSDDNGIGNIEALVASCRGAIRARPGDLRYHQINAIEAPQSPSPWGIMVSSVDPTTGETFATSSNVWTWVNDYWSQLLVDEIRLVKGDLSTQDITEANNVKDWGMAAEGAANKGGVLGHLSKKQIASRVSQFATGISDEQFLDAKPVGSSGDVEFSANFKAESKKFLASLKGIKAAVDAPRSNEAVYEARRKAARGTAFEAELMTQAVKEVSGADTLAMSDSVLDIASPLRGGDLNLQHRFELLKHNALAKRGVCILEANAAQVPLGLTGLADLIEEKFGPIVNKNESTNEHQTRIEQIRKYLARKAHFAVVTHEMGHSISHRHNFVSSSDAWNYRPQYWQLRTIDGTVSDECVDYTEAGETCVGPRYFDPLTEAEKKGLIWMWMQSSVMDYPGEATQDFLGIGSYDLAAARMFYGDVVSVHSDSTFNVNTPDPDVPTQVQDSSVHPRAVGSLSKIGGGFGGILGISHYYGGTQIHYSALNTNFNLISQCAPVTPNDFISARYDTAEEGQWSPVLDGYIVAPDGQTYTRCKQQPVDYVRFADLRTPVEGEFSGYYGAFGAVDLDGRTRVPHGFATDRWADIGNASVYRHDNGADIYEIFNFMISQLETQHIFDTYRRRNSAFSVRSAASRALGRYNAKARDGVKGLGLFRNLAEDWAFRMDMNPDVAWKGLIQQNGIQFREPIVAAGLVFDHFAKELARPESGAHHFDLTPDGETVEIVRSSADLGLSVPPEAQAYIPDGAYGLPYGKVSSGGALIENTLADGLGDFDAEYTMNAGSYYNKMYVSMLLTESVDNFISDSLLDFVDSRYRAVAIAELFPDGYRRLLGNALTGDDAIKGPRLVADEDGVPLTDGSLMIAEPIGWTSWWGETPRHCFPAANTTVCSVYGYEDMWSLGHEAPEHTVPIDPQIGWEQQKFLIAWTMLFLPENQKFKWMDQLRIWELGKDADPGFENRIELHHPSGKIYIAHTFGKEEIFGKTVQKGIAARVLEYANELLEKAYVTTPIDRDGDGETDWYEPVISEQTGEPMVKFDPSMQVLDPGYCNENDSSGCTCNDNKMCVYLDRYVSVPAFLRQAMEAYGLVDPEPKGIYD